MGRIRWALAWALYWPGHWLSFLAVGWLPEWLGMAIYRAYSTLLGWSFDVQGDSDGPWRFGPSIPALCPVCRCEWCCCEPGEQ